MASIRWPNGQVETVCVNIKKEQTKVYDHGHEYDVGYSLPFFIKDVNGLEIEISLEKVFIGPYTKAET